MRLALLSNRAICAIIEEKSHLTLVFYHINYPRQLNRFKIAPKTFKVNENEADSQKIVSKKKLQNNTGYCVIVISEKNLLKLETVVHINRSFCFVDLTE